MYAFQENTVLELELGDMKSHGLFRIVAVDHDLISFVDIPIYQDGIGLPLPTSQSYSKKSERDPIVLITNPKDGRYIIPFKEPAHLIKSSTHIRVLIWSGSEIESVSGSIDGTKITDGFASLNNRGKPWSQITSIIERDAYLPLWSIPWQPLLYDDDEMHVLIVTAVDASGRIGNHTIRFRVDGTRITKMDAGPGGFIISLPLGLLVKRPQNLTLF